MCCQRVHLGWVTAASATQLMRARFSAFSVGDPAYLLRSWHASTRPSSLALDRDQKWTELELLGSTAGGLFDSTGTVEFRAHFTIDGRPDFLAENSRFIRADGAWSYLDAV
jgi:SEC-C motif-containing protein